MPYTLGYDEEVYRPAVPDRFTGKSGRNVRFMGPDERSTPSIDAQPQQNTRPGLSSVSGSANQQRRHVDIEERAPPDNSYRTNADSRSVTYGDRLTTDREASWPSEKGTLSAADERRKLVYSVNNLYKILSDERKAHRRREDRLSSDLRRVTEDAAHKSTAYRNELSTARAETQQMRELARRCYIGEDTQRRNSEYLEKDYAIIQAQLKTAKDTISNMSREHWIMDNVNQGLRQERWAAHVPEAGARFDSEYGLSTSSLVEAY